MTTLKNPKQNINLSLVVADRRWYRLRRQLELQIGRAYKAVGQFTKTKDFSVTVMLADDAQVKILNKQFRGKNKPTNVLSFPNLAGSFDGGGDMILAYETVAKEAKQQGKIVLVHAVHLVVHGFLHLLGYDHETDQDADKMEGLEIQIMQQLGYANPYETEDKHAR